MTWIPDDKYQEIVSLIPIVCVDVAILRGNEILLVKRRDEPMAGEWWLPGGRLYRGESLQGCAQRKSKEETSIHCQVGQMIYYAATDFGNIHSVNFCYILHPYFDEPVVTDKTCLDYRWVRKPLIGLHDYVNRCLKEAFLASLLHEHA